MSPINQSLHLVSLSMVLYGLGACSSNSGDPNGQTSYGGSAMGSSAGAAGHAPGVGGSSGTTPGGSAPFEGPPLLLRPTQKAFDCSVKFPTSTFSDAGAARAVPIPIASDNHVAYALDGFAFENSDIIQYRGLRWATIALDGTLGAPTIISESTPYSLVVATQGGIVSILWSQDESGGVQRLWSAQVNANGQLAGTPKRIWTFAGYPRLVPVANAEGQLALFWAEDARTGLPDGGQAASGYRLLYAQVDASGDFVEAPKPILVDEAQPVVVSAVPHGDAYSVAYLVQRENISQLHYVTLDRSGAALSPAVLVDSASVAVASWGNSVGMLVVKDQVLLASAVQSGSGGSGIARVIHIYRLDTAGNRLGATLALQAPVVDQENVSPTWVKLDDGHVGLLWSKGSVIYTCGGCQPDNHLQFVVLNSETLQPNSDVIDLAPNSTSGGLTSADVVWAAPNLFVTTAIEHHTQSEAASAAIECVAR